MSRGHSSAPARERPIDDRMDPLGIERLPAQQIRRERVQDIQVRRENCPGAGVTRFDERPLGPVDGACGSGRQISRHSGARAGDLRLLCTQIADRPERLAETVLRHHPAGQLVRHLQIIRCAGGD